MVTFRIGTTREDFQSASALIMRVYTRAGYVDSTEMSDTSDKDISRYIGKENTLTVLAEQKGEVLGTISVVPDGAGRLPMDSIYHMELNALRAQGKQIAEVCQFGIDIDRLIAVNREAGETCSELDISVGLLGIAVHYGLRYGYNTLCFAVNPKHASFYESLGCIIIGEEKEYPSVNRAPAIAFALSMDTIAHAIVTGKRPNFLVEKIIATPPSEEFWMSTQQ